MKGTGKGDWEGKMSADRSRRRRGGLFERVGIGGEEGEKGEVGVWSSRLGIILEGMN